MMKQCEFENWVGHVQAKDASERQVKAADYSKPNEDILANFKETAAAVGITPMQAWGVHVYKQVSAVMRFVREGKVSSESIESRLKDIRNYSLLGQALADDPVANAHVVAVTREDTDEIELYLQKLKSTDTVLSPVDVEQEPMQGDLSKRGFFANLLGRNK